MVSSGCEEAEAGSAPGREQAHRQRHAIKMQSQDGGGLWNEICLWVGFITPLPCPSSIDLELPMH
jgi:hypothetical protein